MCSSVGAFQAFITFNSATNPMQYFYYIHFIDEKKKKFISMVVSKWQSLNRNPGDPDSEAPVVSTGSCCFDLLQSDFGCTPSTRVLSLFSNMEDLREASACFGRVNRAKYLSGVAASGGRSLSSLWRAGPG